MIRLRNKATGVELGSITEEDLQFLVDNLEEEGLEDQDYYLNRATVETLKSSGASPSLAQILDQAIGDRDDVEVEWSRG